MNKIYINFHNQKFKWYQLYFWTTKIIKFVTNDKYYHVSCTIDGQYYEATFFSGVVKRSQPSTKMGLAYEMLVDNKTKTHLKKHLNSLLGAKYDYYAILFGFFGFKKHSTKSYFCSELMQAVIKYALDIKINNMKTNLSPKDIRMILSGAKCKYYIV